MPKKKKKTWSEIGLDVGTSVAALAGLFFFSWLNATKFDATELKMIAEFAAYWKILSTIKGAVES